jgi:hypothetical protein
MSESSSNMPEGWVKVFSKTHQKDYFFHKETGKTQWVMPTSDDATAIEAKPAAGEKAEAGDKTSSRPNKAAANNKTAIIVPFRDLHEEQQRKKHLETFIPAMTEYLRASGTPFKVFIIEQSDDGRKFNRGKLLNIGFKLAEAEQCTTFIFHDVDLIPSQELLEWYTTIPSQPAHIARVWNRYSDNPKYFGGVVSFSRDQYRSINGFPNNFWGWGGEDDEMYNRVKRQNYTPVFPTVGSLQDLEEMTLQTKLQFLKKNPTWKCMNKNEMLEEGSDWKTNGLTSLRFVKVKCIPRNAHCDVVTVDVMHNNHWSDLVCKVDDMQYDKTVEALKLQFDAIQKQAAKAKAVAAAAEGAGEKEEGEGSKKRKQSDR